MKITQILLAFLLASSTLKSQNVQISTAPLAPFFVCDTVAMLATIANGQADTLKNPHLTIDLPSGVEYIAGSAALVLGPPLVDFNVADLEKPEILLPNLPKGSLFFTFKVRAKCSLVADINSAQVFTNSHTLVWKIGTLTGVKTTTSLPYKIETPLLVILGVAPPVVEGVLGDMLTRTISIKNTRLGALEDFELTDLHGKGIQVSSNLGQVLQQNDTIFKVKLSNADFKTIGDHDGLFELDEILTFTETVKITDCGLDFPNSNSTISVAWGCGGEVCQTVSTDAFTSILPADLNPALLFQPISHDFVSTCGKPNTQELKITNYGVGTAHDVLLEIKLPPLDNPTVGVLPNSIRLDSAGIFFSIKIDSSGSVFDIPACNLTNLMGGSFFVTIKKISPNTTVRLLFDFVQCDQSCSNFQNLGWELDYKYPLVCPAGSMAKGKLSTPTVGRFTEGTEFDILKNLENGDEGVFRFVFGHNLPKDSTGNFVFDFTFPCGLFWNGPLTLTLDGKTSPLGQVLTNGSTKTYRFTFNQNQFPPSDTILYKASIPWRFECMACSPTKPCDQNFFSQTCPTTCEYMSDTSRTLAVRHTTYVQFDPTVPPECCPKICEDFRLTIDCTDSICVDSVFGFVEKTIAARRISYGKPDNDDNRQADGLPAALDFSKIRTDRTMPYDTVETVIRGVVRSEKANLTFKNAILRQSWEIHTADIGLDGGDFVIVDTTAYRFLEKNITPVFAEIRIKQAATGQEWLCPLTKFIATDSLFGKDSLVNTRQQINLDSWAWMNFAFDLSPAALAADGCPVPPTLELAAADSLIFRARQVFSFNPSGLLNIRDRVFMQVFNGKNSPAALFSCDCPYKRLQITPIFAGLSQVRYNPPNCSPTDFSTTGDPVFSLSLRRVNYFPFEFREIGRLASWRLTVQKPHVLLETHLLEVALQDGSPIIFSGNQLIGQTMPDDTTVVLNTADFNLPPMDEGFQVKIRQKFQTPCSWNKLAKLPTAVTCSSRPPLPANFSFQKLEENPFAPFASDTFGLWPSRPLLTASTANASLTTFGKDASWLFKLKNDGKSEATNGYIFIENSTGGLTDFELKNVTTGQILQPINGVYLLGSLPVGWAQNLLFSVKNTSCSLEKAIFHFGWSCEAISGPPQFPCAERKINLSVQTRKAELEMALSGPTAPIDLCDTIPFHTVEIFNALLGTAYDLRLRVELPVGFHILSGSCQLSYPTGSAWLPTSDPMLIGPGPNGSTIFEWSFSNLNDSLKMRGLLGFQNDPKHSVSLRFLSEAGCGFAAGKQVFFQCFANQNCPAPTNTIKRATEPIQINGVAAPYASNIVIQPSATGLIGCSTDVTLQISLTPDGPTLQNDSVVVTLPMGVSLISNSYQAGTNGPTGPPLVQTVGNQQVIKLKLPSGLPKNTLISFSIKAVGFGSGGCGTADTIRIRSTQRQQAVCTTTGEICSAEGETGTASLIIMAEHPILSLNGFQVNLTGGAFFNVQLKNNGTNPAPLPLRVKIFADTDLSGTLTAADQKIADQLFAFTLVGGAQVNFSGPLAGLGIPAVCHLFAVLESDENCLCTDVVSAVGKVIRNLPDVVFCENQTASIGFASNPLATKYLWFPTTGLANANASMTTLNLDNQGLTPLQKFYTLHETFAPDCAVDNFLNATVLPVQPNLKRDTTICSGHAVGLKASFGKNWAWSGAAGLVQNQQSQTIEPLDSTTVVTAVVTDSAGCMSRDSFFIFVKPSPLADAGPDLVFCENAAPHLTAAMGNGYLFEWSPTNGLSNPSVANPLVINGLGGTFALKVSLPNGCFDLDTVKIDVKLAPQITLSPIPTTLCKGDSIELMASGAGVQTVFWQPPTAFSPIAGSLGTVFFPQNSGSFSVIGLNSDGCRDTLDFMVNVPGSVVKTEESRAICEGETTLIFGQAVGSAGTFCKTGTAITGCDSTHCVKLTVLPKGSSIKNASVCAGQTVVVDGVSYSTEGTFCQNFSGANGCDSTACVVVTVLDTAFFSQKFEAKVEQGQMIQLQVPPGFANYEWSPATFLSCIDCPNPIFTAPAEGLDSIVFTVKLTNGGGCGAEISYLVRVFPPCAAANVKIPNAFTPNDDGLNDHFQAFSEGFETLGGLQIYDRWGERLWVGDATTGWNGLAKNGKALPMDVYVWVLNVTCPSGTEKRVGDVSLIR